MTTTKTETKLKKETEPSVRPNVLKVVKAYIQTESKLESKLWPMVNEAIKLFEIPMERDEVLGQFRGACALELKLSQGEFTKSIEYARFRMVSLNVTRVASMGREWVTEHHLKQKTGFWTMLDLVNTKIAKQGEPEANAKPTPSSSSTKPAAGKSKVSAAVENENEEEYGATDEEDYTTPEAKATPEWSNRTKYIIQHEPDAFIELITEAVDRGWLPDVILPELVAYMKGE